MHDDLVAARSLAERQHWLITADQLMRLGVARSDVDAVVKTGAWCAVLRGVYLLDADCFLNVPPSVLWRAALLAHGPHATLFGRTSARASGFQGLPYDDPCIEIAFVGSAKSRSAQALDAPSLRDDCPLVVVRQVPLRPDEVTVVDGMRVTVAARTVVDAGLQLDRVHALCVLDSALHLGALSSDDLASAVADASRRRGCRQLRDVLAIADGRAESPLESRVRLACVDGGLAPDELQYAVTVDNGAVVAIGDLAWLRRRRPLLAECDGADVHARPVPVYRDRRRGNVLTGLACDTVRFTWPDAFRPAYIQYVVREALAAA